jgi:hypothetical protein
MLAKIELKTYNSRGYGNVCFCFVNYAVILQATFFKNMLKSCIIFPYSFTYFTSSSGSLYTPGQL